jgi:hypothetical protein
MAGETDISRLLATMQPELNPGEYVFCTLTEPLGIDPNDIIGSFKEQEGLTVILDKNKADYYGLTYDYVASWITLTVHSSLAAVGLTAAFSHALASEGISCNVIAAYYHDHIFIAKKDAKRAMLTLQKLAES